MRDSLDAPLAEFREELERIRNLLSLIESCREFGSIPVPDSPSESTFDLKARNLREIARNQHATIPILSGTLVLYLSGRFENFVRRAFELACDSIASKCMKFDHLPKKMKENLQRYTAEVILQSRRHKFDEIQIQTFIINLANNIQAAGGIGDINSACLSVTEGNMRSETVSDLFKRIGIDSLWAEVSKQSKMKMYFENDKDGEIERKAKLLLDEFMQVRNTIAHPSNIPTFPDSNKMISYLEFIEVLSEVMVDVCRVQLLVIKPDLSK